MHYTLHRVSTSLSLGGPGRASTAQDTHLTRSSATSSVATAWTYAHNIYIYDIRVVNVYIMRTRQKLRLANICIQTPSPPTHLTRAQVK